MSYQSLLCNGFLSEEELDQLATLKFFQEPLNQVLKARPPPATAGLPGWWTTAVGENGVESLSSPDAIDWKARDGVPAASALCGGNSPFTIEAFRDY